MFNGSLAPFTHMTIRGALFYQEENNAFGNSWKPYRRTLSAVIPDWRAVFGDPDKVFHNAHARIARSKDKREQLIVWCEKVPNPVAVRYASSNLPVGGLMNGRELPAFPFRSDNWPITPHQSTGSYVRMQGN